MQHFHQAASRGQDSTRKHTTLTSSSSHLFQSGVSQRLYVTFDPDQLELMTGNLLVSEPLPLLGYWRCSILPKKKKKTLSKIIFLFKLWTLSCWFFNFLIFLTLKTPSCNKNNIRSLRLLEITLQWSNITFWFTKTLHMSPDLCSLHKKSCRNSSVWTVKSHFLLKGNESLTVEVSPFF